MAGINFQGILIGISTDGVAYTPIGCITSYTRAGTARAEIDTTCNTSTSKEFSFGLRDNGTLSVDVNYDPEGTGWGMVEDSEASDTPYFFQIEFPNPVTPVTGDGTKKTFEGYVINTSDTGSVDSIITASLEVKIDGDITTTPAT